jgi:hypothetical protein
MCDETEKVTRQRELGDENATAYSSQGVAQRELMNDIQIRLLIKRATAIV